MVFASIREYAEDCDFFASTSRNKKIALRACEQRRNLDVTKTRNGERGAGSGERGTEVK